jgi:hypothetical protein
MNSGAAAGLAVVALGAGLGAGWMLAGKPAEQIIVAPPAKETARTAGTDAEALRREVAQLKEAVASAEVRAKAAELRAEESVRLAAEAAAAAAVSPTPATPTKAGATDAGARAILFQDFDPSLATTDWKSVGGNMSAMVPLLRELGIALLNGEELPPKVIGAIQQHNGPLVTAALSLGEKLGTSPNGKFSHPAFMVNAIASTLDAAGKPLSDAQYASLQTMGQEFMGVEERRIAGYDEHTWELKKLIEELESKEKFFAGALGMLSDEQREALVPEETAGRAQVDIFSPALVLAGRINVDRFADAADLTEKGANWLRMALRLPESRNEDVKAVVQQWVAQVPTALMEDTGDALSRMHMVHYTTALAWGKAMLTLLRNAETALPFDDAMRTRAKQIPYITVLFKQ